MGWFGRGRKFLKCLIRLSLNFGIAQEHLDMGFMHIAAAIFYTSRGIELDSVNDVLIKFPWFGLPYHRFVNFGACTGSVG